MFLKKIIISSTICIISFNLLAQNYLILEGVVVDQKSNRVIPYASISICNLSIGVVSNDNGEFVLKIPTAFIDQSLCVSSLGYKTYNNAISNFSESAYHIIKLENKVYNIQEVRISVKNKQLNPIKIVQNAIDMIPVNCPIEPFTMQGYYREYLNQGGQKYLNLFEAALVINDRGFKSNFFPYRANLIQVRYNKEYETDKDFQSEYSSKTYALKKENSKYIPEHVMPILGGNELSILFAHDAIRRYNEITYSYVNQFNKDFVENHNFTLDSITYQEDIPVYCISFEYKDNVIYQNRKGIVKSRIKGRMLIRSNSYAIERFEYVSYSIVTKGKKNFEIIADYKSHNGKMYLNYLSFSNFFKQAITARNAQYELPIEKQPLETQ